jgi:hypothetical protein
VFIVASFMSMSSDPRLRGVSRNIRGGKVPRDGREGLIAAFDVDSGKIFWSQVLDSPTGFTFVDKQLFVSSMYGHRITVINDQLEVHDSFAVPLMNDLHSVRPSSAGILVTSSGTDAILEMSLEGDLRWAWLAREHSYWSAPNGVASRVSRFGEYRSGTSDTEDQSTHCNSALVAERGGREAIFATLFHQGTIIAIDKISGRHEVVFRGLGRPHALRRLDDGWIVCDSYSGAVVLLTEDFWISRVFEEKFNWVIDAMPLENTGHLLIADSNNSRLAVWDVSAERVVHQMTYPSGWRIFQIDTPPQGWIDAFMGSGGGKSNDGIG